MSLPTSTRCLECGEPVAAGMRLGLCLRCSLREALAADSDTTMPEGEFELLEEIARGGMGVVFRARQRSLGRTVALKMLLGGALSGDAGRRRLQAEAEAAGKLQHPGIVAVHGTGTLDGQPFYTMDFVEGRTLAQCLEDFRFHSSDAARPARLIAQIADAVHYAHGQGVLHRDLKPSNVLITTNGDPRVTDFGIARRTDATTGLTLSGQVLGSPNYMPPEQALGRATDARCDVYALGAMLYELLTGRPPFQGDTAAAVIEQVKTLEAIPPRRLNASVPADLETVCLKCLEKEPARRYVTASELADDLHRFIRGEPVQARPLGTAGRAWRWVQRHRAAAAAMFAVVAALAAVAVISAVKNVQISNSRALAEQRAAESQANLVRSLEGTANRFFDNGDSAGALPFLLRAYELESDAGERRVLGVSLGMALRGVPVTERVWSPGGRIECAAFSPDGRRVVCTIGTTRAFLWGLDSSAAPELVLEHEAPVLFASFSPDSRSVLTCSGDKLFVWNVKDGERFAGPVAHTGHFDSRSDRMPPEWMGDSQVLAIAGKTARLYNSATAAAMGPEISCEADITGATPVPGGTRVVLTAADRSLRIVDATTGEADGAAFARVKAPRRPFLNEQGTRLGVISEGTKVIIFDLAAREAPEMEAAHPDQVHGAAFIRHDGRLPATFFTACEDGYTRIWQADNTAAVLTLPQGGAVQCVQQRHGEPSVISGARDGVVQVQEQYRGLLRMPSVRHAGPVLCVDSDATGRLILSGSADGTLRVSRPEGNIQPGSGRGSLRSGGAGPAFLGYAIRDETSLVTGNPFTGKIAGPLLNHPAPVESVSFSGGARVATVTNDGALTLWDVKNAEPLQRIARGLLKPQRVLLAPDGRSAAIITTSGTIEIRSTKGDLLDEGFVLPLMVVPKVRDAVISPDSRRIAVVDYTRRVTVWSMESAERAAGPLGPETRAGGVWWSPDSRSLAIASGGTVRVWSAETGAALSEEMRHLDAITAVAFSADGKWLATGGGDNLAQVWAMPSGHPAGAPLLHRGAVNFLAFSPDSRLLASTCTDKAVRFWRVHGGEPVGPPSVFSFTAPGTVGVGFSEDGNSLLVLRGDGGIRARFYVVNLRGPDIPPAELADHVALASGFRLDAAGSLRAVPAAELAALWEKLRGRSAMQDGE